jgi:hypothetical protein
MKHRLEWINRRCKPESLAFVLLEAAGSVAHERCGAIFEERVAEDRAGEESAE